MKRKVRELCPHINDPPRDLILEYGPQENTLGIEQVRIALQNILFSV